MRSSILKVVIALTLLLGWLAVQPMLSETLVVTSLAGYQGSNNGSILQVDTSTNTITTILSIGGNPDSVVFAPNNTLIFSLPNQSGIGVYNTVTQDLNYFHGNLFQPLDLALDPSGTSVLVADSGNSNGPAGLKRIDLTQQFPIPTIVASGFGDIDGITYDNKGNFYAVVDGRWVEQLDPITGALIKRIECAYCVYYLDELDGITYDPGTDSLWVSDTVWNGIWKIPVNLSSSTLYASGKIGYPDGIESDGAGNIFVAARTGQIFEYNIANNTTTGLTMVPGLDDLAPLIGRGSPNYSPSVPEPASFVLVGAGLLALARKARKT